MKRQSKPEKIKKEKSTAPGEWLYFAPERIERAGPAPSGFTTTSPFVRFHYEHHR